MRLAGTVTLILMLCMIFCSEVYGGLGGPLPSQSLDPDRRRALVDEITQSTLAKAVKDRLGEEKTCAVIERLPDSELNNIARNLRALPSGGSVTLAELFVQLILVAALLGLLLILLMVLGVVALFAGASAASAPKGAPVGKHQYEQQRSKTEDTKQLRRPAEEQK